MFPCCRRAVVGEKIVVQKPSVGRRRFVVDIIDQRCTVVEPSAASSEEAPTSSEATPQLRRGPIAVAFLILIGGASLALVVGAAERARNEAAHATATQESTEGVRVEATTLDWGECLDCHGEIGPTMADGPHITLVRDGLPPGADANALESSCEACHGSGAAHMEEGGDAPIFAFGPEESRSALSARCQTCHLDDHPRFASSSHARSGLACTSCHAVHEAPAVAADQTLQPWTLEGRVSATCAECHGQELAEFSFNERHRLEEGILECTSCHDPHAPSPRVALGGFKALSQCGDCHVDKTGPFVFEHGSVTVEGCSSCHAVHGSPNRHMLHFQNVAEQCYSCHALVPGFHTRFTNETVCTNCHSTIHGSNLDRSFLK